MKNIILIAFLLACLISALISCRDKNEVNCDCAERINANFVIEEPSGYFENGSQLFFETDTVLTGDASITRFRALQDDNDYSWIVGTSANTSELQSWGLNNFPEDQSIEVELSVTGNPELDCFPDDDGADTQTKSFVAVDVLNSPINGSYHGTVSYAPLDTFEMTIMRVNLFPKSWGEETYIQNFPSGSFVDLDTDELDDHNWWQHFDGGANCLSIDDEDNCFESFGDFPNNYTSTRYTAYFYKRGNQLFGKGRIRYRTIESGQVISVTTQEFTYHGFKVH